PPLRYSLQDRLYNAVRDGILDASRQPTIRYQLSGLLTDVVNDRAIDDDTDDDSRILDLKRAVRNALRFTSLKQHIKTLCAECLDEMGKEHIGRTSKGMLERMFPSACEFARITE